MDKLDNKLKTNGEQTDEGLLEHIVNKYWYKFSYGIFTDEQLKMFFEDLNNSKLDFSLVILAMLMKKREVHSKQFDSIEK